MHLTFSECHRRFSVLIVSGTENLFVNKKDTMDLLNTHLQWLRLIVNEHFRGQEPWRIVAVTSSTVISAAWLYNFIFQDESITSRAKNQVFTLAKKIPYVAKQIEQQLGEIRDGFEKDVEKRVGNLTPIPILPEQGLSDQEILHIVDEHLKTGDYDWKQGRVSGAIYRHDQKVVDLITQVYGKSSYTNPLHPDVFPGLCKMEAEVVKMSANLFNGGPETCGTMTTGGTESIMMAVKACRDFGRTEKGIRKPELVVPSSAHPAFDKAAAYFKVKIVHVPLDKDMRVNLRKMRRAISGNTIMLVGSAPNYPYGTMDDIEAIQNMGLKYNIPVHVDACLGGFLIAFMAKAGYSLPPFDFRLPGVTSMSADTHKYGYAPKGSSVVLYRSKSLLHHQYTVTTDWSGGVYGSPTVNGSRAGGVIAACWATMLHFGIDGYVSATAKVVEAARYIESELRKMEGLYVFGTPVTSVVAIGSDTFHIYRLSDALSKRGWSLNPLQYPPGVHLCVTHIHTEPGVKEAFIRDVREEVAEIMKDPSCPVEGKMAMYGMTAKIPDRSIVADVTKIFLDSMYYTCKAKAIDGANGIAKQ